MAHQTPVRNGSTVHAAFIPDKLYFRIGEVARLCEVPAYVLRFWESEFPQLRPNKGGTGQRLFRRRDVEIALRIKGLLYDEGYTIPGARQLLRGETKPAESSLPTASTDPAVPPPEQLVRLRNDLQDLLNIVSRPVSPRVAAEPVRRQRAVSTVDSRMERLFDFAESGLDNGSA